MTVSVLIMTLNEEANLPACLASLDWCDDIVVLDSFSTDRTVEIARAAGARIYQRAYDTEDRQRMYGLTEIEFRHAWVYTPDADEITPPDLRDEMLAIAADPDRPEVFFKARYKNMFMGRWIRHASLYPTWITRLVRPDRVHFERSVHSRASGGPGAANYRPISSITVPTRGWPPGMTSTTVIPPSRQTWPPQSAWNATSIGAAFYPANRSAGAAH